MCDHQRVDSKTDLSSSQVEEYVHPASACVLRAAPFVNYIPIFNITIRSFHPKLVFAICMQRMFEKGVASGLIRHSLQPMLTGRYELSGKLYQRYASSYSLGWALSSLITVMADTIAVFGYTKRWYCVLSALCGALFAVLYGLLPADESSAKPAAVFLIMTALFMSNIDVFAVALYSEHIRRRPSAGPALVSWMWGTALIGLMVSSLIQGPLSDKGMAQVGVFIAGGIVFMSGLLFLFNLLQERRNKVARWADAKLEFLKKSNTPDHAIRESLSSPKSSFDAEQVAGQVDDDEDGERAASYEQKFVPPQVKTYLGGVLEINQDVFLQNWRMALFCLILTLGVIGHAIVNIMGTTSNIMCSCITVALVVCISSYFTLPRTIANTVVFFYFNAILYLNLPGVLNTFYRASPSCVPGGPNFSYTFYDAMTGVVGNIASIAGTMIFTHLFPNRSYRFVMSLSAVLLPAASMFDLIILKRWNVAIGIPDHAMYVFGDAVIYEVCDMLLNMPTMMLMCRIAPRGAESIVFAILASIYHLGTSTSTAIGYLLMDTIWPVVTKGKCDYSNAPWLVITGHIIAPLFIFPLAYIFLPSARISDNIDHTGQKITVAETSEHCSEPTREPAAATKKTSG